MALEEIHREMRVTKSNDSLGVIASGSAPAIDPKGAVDGTPSRAPRAADKVIVQDLLVRCVIGLNAWERDVHQDILINLVLFCDARASGESDQPTDILNYRTITKAIIEHVEASSYHLVEALATAIARICVLDHGAARAIVRVEKPGALRFARSVGIEIERAAEDFGG